MERPFVVYKGGRESTGGGDPVPASIVDSQCVCDDFGQCNLIGIDGSGELRATSGQGWPHLGKLYADSNAIWHDFHWVFKCNCRRSRVKTHHPSMDCNEHAMNVHIATTLIRSVVSMLGCALPGAPIRCS